MQAPLLLLALGSRSARLARQRHLPMHRVEADMRAQAAETAANEVQRTAQQSAFSMLGPMLTHKYEVVDTGAYLSMQEAKARLMMFCARLPSDKCGPGWPARTLCG